VVLADKTARILSKQPQHSKGPGPEIDMLACGCAQLVSVEINNMTWQRNFMPRRSGLMAGYGCS
jgi:hypothetical protein